MPSSHHSHSNFFICMFCVCVYCKCVRHSTVVIFGWWWWCCCCLLLFCFSIGLNVFIRFQKCVIESINVMPCYMVAHGIYLSHSSSDITAWTYKLRTICERSQNITRHIATFQTILLFLVVYVYFFFFFFPFLS